MLADMPYHSIDQLLQAFRERDIWLFFALFLIGGLYYVATRREGEIDEYHRANPGAKAMYDAWRKEQGQRQSARRPLSVFCPLHRVPRDECASKHEEEP